VSILIGVSVGVGVVDVFIIGVGACVVGTSVNVDADVGTKIEVVVGAGVGASNTGDVVEISGGFCDGAGVGGLTQAPSKATKIRRIDNSVLVLIEDIS
jgi:hypothetical protein